MKYLLDTDISSYYLRGKNNLLNIFERKGFQNIRVSRPTVAELKVLACKNKNSIINISAIDNFTRKLGILEINTEIWDVFSETKAELSNKGKPRGDFDILIASVANYYNMILITNNISHYEDITKVENWINMQSQPDEPSSALPGDLS